MSAQGPHRDWEPPPLGQVRPPQPGPLLAAPAMVSVSRGLTLMGGPHEDFTGRCSLWGEGEVTLP